MAAILTGNTCIRASAEFTGVLSDCLGVHLLCLYVENRFDDLNDFDRISDTVDDGVHIFVNHPALVQSRIADRRGVYSLHLLFKLRHVELSFGLTARENTPCTMRSRIVPIGISFAFAE